MPGATGSFYDAVVGRTSSSDGVDGVLLASVFSDFRGNIRRVGGNKKSSSRNWLATINNSINAQKHWHQRPPISA